MNDLIILSYKAQCSYVGKRISSKKDQNTFVNAVNDVLNNVWENMGIKFTTNSKYYKMAQDMWDETEKNINERFVTGRSGDAYMEKL